MRFMRRMKSVNRSAPFVMKAINVADGSHAAAHINVTLAISHGRGVLNTIPWQHLRLQDSDHPNGWPPMITVAQVLIALPLHSCFALMKAPRTTFVAGQSGQWSAVIT